MILYITEVGDWSVGISDYQYEIICPFNQDETEPEHLEYFRNKQKELYEQFCEGRILCQYDFELKQEAEEEL